MGVKLGTCCNLDCSQWSARRRFRCGPCRHDYKYRCCACNTEIRTAGKIYCDGCKEFVMMLHFRKSHGVGDMKCIMCDDPMFGGQRKTCKGDCTRIYRNLKMQVYQ